MFVGSLSIENGNTLTTHYFPTFLGNQTVVRDVHGKTFRVHE